ncbi:hypothetical protein NHJ6243_009403 [Beauveria neobassiana]
MAYTDDFGDDLRDHAMGFVSMHLRRAIHETARRHDVSVKTWHSFKLTDEEAEGDNSPFLRHDWGRIIVELQCLKIPDPTEAPWAYQFAKYLESFCELYTAQDPPSVKVYMLFLRPHPRGDYELLKDLFVKLSFSMVYIEELSVDEKKKLLIRYGEYLRFCQDATPKSRLRGFRR